MDNLCQVLLKLAKWFLRRRFLKVVNYFLYVAIIISPWKNAWPLIWIWIPFIQEYFVWPSCFVEIGPAVLEKIFKSCQFFLLSPLEKGQGPLFERNYITLTQGCSLVEIGPVVLENKSSMYFEIFLLCSYYLPLTMLGHAPSFEQTWIICTQNALCQVWWNLTRWSWTN